ncbi:hypothetical protein UCRPC4_g00301 [Phaeomoniella chlamydospora]|uniref:Uncharacterized protein n=1 Tax=Phaeomoniella chlamydospora TaxID=158046 RepID=A0A0G2F261_PHACM|nr:hypothetical protein UCRPC4_g00301 [Phaeomoniella chlamydospora]
MPSSGSQTASGATQRVERTHRTRGGLVKMVFNERKRKWYDDNGRERDPRTGRCINKPKGPQGNKPQNVTGITASWDFGKADKTILSNVQREIQRLQAGLRRVTPLPYYVSDLKQTGWPWLCLIIVHQGIAVKMQIVIRDVNQYPNHGHYIECRFQEGQDKEHALTFRKFGLSEFLKYFVRQYDDRVRNDEVAEDLGAAHGGVALKILNPTRDSKRCEFSSGITWKDIAEMQVSLSTGHAKKAFYQNVLDAEKRIISEQAAIGHKSKEEMDIEESLDAFLAGIADEEDEGDGDEAERPGPGAWDLEIIDSP